MNDDIPSERWLQWILLELEGSLGAEERAELERWRSACVANDLLYREIASIWHGAGDADGLEGVDWEAVAEARPGPAELLEAARTSPARQGLRQRGPARLRTWMRGAVAVAASALLGFLAARSWGPGTSLFAEEFITGPNELVTVNLSDGTVVRLGPQSRIRVADQRNGRQVSLHGQAFFSVPPRSSERFVVHTAVGRAVVLGTRFQVESRGEDFRLTVLQGAVEVVSDAGRVQARQGEVAHMARGTPPAVVELADIPALFQWMGSFLAFENTPLRQVAREVEAVYGVRVQISDPLLAERVVTGRFSEKDVAEVMSVVCRVVDARCVIADSVVVLSRRTADRPIEVQKPALGALAPGG